MMKTIWYILSAAILVAVFPSVCHGISYLSAVEKWSNGNSYPFRTDEEIENAVKEVLRRDPRVPSYEIFVKSENGYVTLQGEVKSHGAVRAACQDTLEVAGVRGVINQIEVSLRDPPRNLPLD